MAMRGRAGGRGNPNRPPRMIVNRVYEQFKPMSEWRQEDDYDTLLVYLPGFQKEYIKVTTEDVNVVRVRGERLVAENKWSRFQEDYRVPENCEMRGIRAKFDGGILTITMPRKIINAPPPPPTMARAAPKTEPPRKPKEEPKEKKPDKPQTTRLENNILPPQPKPASSLTPPTEQRSSKPTPEAIGPLPKDGFENDAVEKPGVGEKTGLAKGKGKESILKEETKRDFVGGKEKPNHSGVVSGGLRGIVASRAMNEDRRLLVNVGMGVLMIVALGVHVSYTMGLIGKGK